ncbi:MAG: hypothetical protein GC162_01275 [Planctomycetes bacterium]|nr:hypothetical protein [Planctomycetota bacterium]
MNRLRQVLPVLGISLFIGIAALSVIAADEQPAPKPAAGQSAEGDRGNRGDRRREFSPEDREKFMQQMRERMSAAMKERLNATDDEWAVIEPRLQKVMETRVRSAMGGMRGMFGGRGPGGPGGDNADRQPSQAQPGESTEMALRSRELADLLKDENAAPEAIKAAMQKLREAKAKQEEDAKKAREDLRGVLSLRQEATLVTMGILD